MLHPTNRLTLLAVLLSSLATRNLHAKPSATQDQAHPGARVLMDAHNCYPYFEWWGDRINRALATGTPLAIEQDLLWYRAPAPARPTPSSPTASQPPARSRPSRPTSRPGSPRNRDRPPVPGP